MQWRPREQSWPLALAVKPGQVSSVWVKGAHFQETERRRERRRASWVSSCCQRANVLCSARERARGPGQVVWRREQALCRGSGRGWRESRATLSQLALLPLRLPDLWVSSCGSRPHRDILRSSSKSDSKAASREHGCPGAAGVLGRGAHWASRLLSSSSLSSQLSPWSRGVGVVSRGPERGRGSLPGEPLKLWKLSERLWAPDPGSGLPYLVLLAIP